MSETVVYNGFRHIGLELKKRTLGPIRHFSFWFFLLFGVIGFGGVGLWYECVKEYFQGTNDHHAIRTALVTFAPALAGSTTLQLIAASSNTKQMRLFGGLCLCLLFIVPGWLTFDHSMREHKAFAYAGVMALFSIWLWWIANAEEELFRDEPDPSAAVGGDARKEPSGHVDDDIKY